MGENETETLEMLRTAFDRARLPYSPWKGKLCLTSREIATLQAMQTCVPSTTRAYADICCLLAYFGIDYPANLTRLLSAYTHWRGNPTPSQAQYAGQQECLPDLRALPEHLARLYHRWQDPVTLDWLLGLRLPGEGGRRACLECVALLWDEHFIAILSLAAASPSHVDRIAASLAHVCHTLGIERFWWIYASHLRLAYCHSRDRDIKQVAQKVLTQLKRLRQVGVEKVPCNYQA